MPVPSAGGYRSETGHDGGSHPARGRAEPYGDMLDELPTPPAKRIASSLNPRGVRGGMPEVRGPAGEGPA